MGKSRVHWLVLYPDDPSHVDAMQKLDDDLYRYSAILHDHDLNEDGSIKKAHYNILVKFNAPRSADSFAKELGIGSNYIKYVGNTKSAERYHLHLDNPEKSTYSLQEVFGTDVDSVIKACSQPMSESAEVMAIINLLDSYNCRVSVKQFLIAICENELYATFRRMGGLATSLLFEHNNKFSKEGEKNNA